MTITIILLNIYYIGITIALLVRDILWLRTVMIFAGISIITYGIVENNNVIIMWNSLFLTINIIQIIRLELERRHIHIAEDIIDIYKDVFFDMTKYEFRFFWKHGSIQEVEDDLICKEGVRQNKLYLILSGKVRIERSNKFVGYLGRGSFIADMAFLTKGPATADVIAYGKVKYITWHRAEIENMKKVYPDILNKLQLEIGKDLIHKLQNK